jgi:hypothetical protein
MFRGFAVTVSILMAGAAPVVAQMPPTSHAQMHAMLMPANAPMDSVQCATLHATLRDHLANGLDSTQMAAVHAMLLAHAGYMQLDSAQLESVHAAVREAVANGSIDSAHVALFHVLMHGSAGMPMDSAQTVLIGAMHACLNGGTADKTPRAR